jgi:large subunit ribosomal protein L2
MLKRYKATSPGIRSRRTLKEDVSDVRPEKKLTVSKKGSVGRNKGTISVRHRQQGVKKHYRLIDFKRNKLDIPGKVATLEHDPNRGCNIALINYFDGEKRYILAPEGLKIGMQVMSGQKAPLEVGNTLPLSLIPISSKIHNVELNPGRGGQLARGAGNYATLMAKEGDYATLKLPSGEVKKILAKCYATIGELGNADLRHARAGKAGIKRHKGWRPAVRGVAMGTEAHPHGGSYSDTGIGMPSPKSPWGQKTRGYKTRRRKHTDKYIIKRRSKRK